MVIAVPPAFGTVMTKTIIDIPHQQVLREIMAGIEEEGLKARLVKVYRTADVAFISHEAAKLSGSGIGIGVLSRGTSVIHQKDLKPLQNLELFSQSPLVDTGNLSRHWPQCRQIRQGGESAAGAHAQRSHGEASLPGTGRLAPQQGGPVREPGKAVHGGQGSALGVRGCIHFASG